MKTDKIIKLVTSTIEAALWSSLKLNYSFNLNTPPSSLQFEGEIECGDDDAECNQYSKIALSEKELKVRVS